MVSSQVNETHRTATQVLQMTNQTLGRLASTLSQVLEPPPIATKQEGQGRNPIHSPWSLYQQRVAMGDADDIMEAKLQTLDKLNREIEQNQNRVRKLQDSVRLLEQTVTRLTKNLDDCLGLKTEIKTHSSKINKLGKRDDILLRMGQEQENEIKKLNENVNVLFEALNQLNQEKEVQEEE